MDVNRVVVCGRLTKDPELKSVSGYDLCTFTIAVGKKTKDKKLANFFDVNVWGKLAVIIKDFASKGKQVIVDGKLDQQTWDDKDGSKRSKIVIIADSVQLVGAKSEASNKPDDPYNYIPEPTNDLQKAFAGSEQQVDDTDIF